MKGSSEGKKGVQPGTSKVHLMKWPILTIVPHNSVNSELQYVNLQRFKLTILRKVRIATK